MNNTIKFATFPFTHKGINFVSRVAETSRFLPQIMMMGEEFIAMNKGAVDELIDLDNLSSLDELHTTLAHINDGGSEMFLEFVSVA